MTFSELLKQYITRLDTTYSRLAKASGLSVSAVSNYVKGEREPSYESEQAEKLIKGILSLAKEKNVPISEQELRLAFQGAAKNGLPIEYDVYLANLNALLKTLEIKGSTLAKALSYDASHISKVLAGQRRPADIGKFTARVAAYVTQFYSSDQEIAAVFAGMKGKVGDADHAAAAPAGVDVGGVVAGRGVGDIGGEADVGGGGDCEQQREREYVH